VSSELSLSRRSSARVASKGMLVSHSCSTMLTHLCSRSGQPGIKANQKAVQGDLFMLEKFIFFVSKQPTLIELADVHQVVFSRVGSGMGASAVRTFDLKVVTKSAPEYTFTSINKEEHEAIEGFLRAKKVRVKNEMMQDVDMLAAAVALDDDDDEMQSVASDGEDVPRPRAGGDDDEDSEEGKCCRSSHDRVTEQLFIDEDFRASDSDSGSPSESSGSDDGGKTASDASGDREIGKSDKKKKKVLTKKKPKADAGDGEKPKKKKKAAKSKEEVDDDVEVMDVDDEEKPKPKPKPRPKAAKSADDEDGPAKKKLKTSDD
jgi:structure-specific recognition protein 1